MAFAETGAVLKIQIGSGSPLIDGILNLHLRMVQVRLECRLRTVREHPFVAAENMDPLVVLLHVCRQKTLR